MPDPDYAPERQDLATPAAPRPAAAPARPGVQTGAQAQQGLMAPHPQFPHLPNWAVIHIHDCRIHR